MERFGHFSSRTRVSGTSSDKRRGRRAAMTDRELENYLRENGYPEHISRAGRPGLISRWKQFVDEVEKGYKLGLEDYRNDLDLRGIIALAGLGDEVKETDAQFEKLLTARDKRVWESLAE